MATLAALSNLNGSTRGQAALGILLERSFILRFLEQQSAFEEAGTQFETQPIAGEGTLQTRPIGGAFTPTLKLPGARIAGQLAIYGDKIQIDRTHLDDAARGLSSMDVWLEAEARMRVRDLASKLDSALMDDPGTGTTMRGLARILDGTPLPGFGGVTGVLDARAFGGAGTSFDLTAGAATAQHDAFIEGLQQALVRVPDAAALVVSRRLGARLSTLARRAHMNGEARDLFGRPVQTFDGVPIYVVSDTAITATEPSNSSAPTNDTTSIYVLAPGEGKLSIATNSGLYYREWDHLETKETNQEMFEMRMAWKIEDAESALRIRNIKI